MRSIGSRAFITQLIRVILVSQVFFSAEAKSASQDSWFAPVKDGLGIYINDQDYFWVSVAHSTSTQVDSVISGYIDVQELFSAHAIISDSLGLGVPRPEVGKIWSTFANDTNHGVVLLRTVLEELRAVLGIKYFQSCVVVTSLYLPNSLRDLLVPIIEEVFECPENASLSPDIYYATNSISVPDDEPEEFLAALVVPRGFTFILGGFDDGLFDTLDVFPSQPALEQLLSNYNIAAVTIIQDEESNRPWGSTFGPNSTPIKYVHPAVISQGAAVAAANGIMRPPVEITPLALGVVLHGTLSHVLIDRNWILPSTINITLTTTNDNQRTAIIELREGSRPRLNDTLPLMSLILDGLPASPASALQIYLAVTIDYHHRVVMEAFEPISGVREKRIQELNKGYGGDFLDNFIQDAERHQAQDEEFRNETNNRWLNGGGSDLWAVKLAEDSSRGDNL